LRIEKIIQKMLQIPKEMAYKDIVRVLKHEGWVLRKAKGTSHRNFKKSGVAEIITLSPPSSKQKIKTYQVREIIQILELEEKYGKK